jgi:hypothetical protein
MKNKTKYHTVGKVKSRNKRGEIIKKLLLKINKMHVNRKLKRGVVIPYNDSIMAASFTYNLIKLVLGHMEIFFII